MLVILGVWERFGRWWVWRKAKKLWEEMFHYRITDLAMQIPFLHEVDVESKREVSKE